MGIYNAYPPDILGNEWVPIREEATSLPYMSPNVAFGHTFPITAAYALNELRFYIKEYASDSIFTSVTGEIYPAGMESASGPVKRILIPASAGSITGSDVSFDTSMQASLLDPSDSLTVDVNMSESYSGQQGFTAYFAGSTYATALAGKRILGINVLYTMFSNATVKLLEEQNSTDGTLAMQLNSNTTAITLGTSDWALRNQTQIPFDINLGDGADPPDNYYRVPLSNRNFFWNGASVPASSQWGHWIPSDLARFEASASAATRLGISLIYTAPGSPAALGFSAASQWGYMALEVFYCEETRVAVGITSSPETRTTNEITLRDATARTATPSIGPGSFTAVISSIQDCPAFQLPSPLVQVEALRQLYQIPTLAGIQINMPFPYDPSIEGEVFTDEPIDILPHLSLHTSSAVIIDTHPYGRQVRAEVWGSITAVQDIRDQAAGGTHSYPWIRFYARRFGDTTVPMKIFRASQPTTQYAFLDPAEFDALPEIIDGWKEVTLRFEDVIPTMGSGSNPAMTFSATGESAGNRWEILGASALALSGTPGNLNNQSPQQMASATYGMPNFGSAISATWYPQIAPLVTVSTVDTNSDLSVMLSRDPIGPASLSVSPVSQALTTVDPLCPVSLGCTPTALEYNQLSWPPISGTSFDDFNTISASGWGSTNLGQVWQYSSGASVNNTSKSGGYGVVTHPAGTNSDRLIFTNVGSHDQDIRAEFSVSAFDTANAFELALVARYTDDNNFYRLRVVFGTASPTMAITIRKFVTGTGTTLGASYVLPIPPVAAVNTFYKIRFKVGGQILSGKVWEASKPEPSTWQVVANDSSLTTGNNAGVFSADNSAAGDEILLRWDNFYVQPQDYGATEIQRFDPIDGEFNTIMLSTNAAVTGFADYEARVGQPSVYRIRHRNVYDFNGLWAPQVTGTISSPGVTGGDTALMLFTSNARQDGSLNLAYSAAWESNPVESFQWPEAGQVALQDMYGKDFPTAFHPLERGGETFSRSILVNAAGVPPVATQNGFRYLREMAWDEVPYICVRDELGNRWYATILVSEGNRRRMVAAGSLLMASVRVVETSLLPYPVDPE